MTRINLLDLLIIIYGVCSIIFNYLRGEIVSRYAFMIWIAIAVPYALYRFWLYWPIFKFLHRDSIVDINVYVSFKIKIKIRNVRKPYRAIKGYLLEKIMMSKIREMLEKNTLPLRNFEYDLSKYYEDLIYLKYYNKCSEREYSIKLSSNIKLYKDEKDILKIRGEIEIDNAYFNLLIDGEPSGEFLPIEFKCLKQFISDTFVFISNLKESIQKNIEEFSHNNFTIKLVDIIRIPMIIKFRRLASRKVKKNIEEIINLEDLKIEQKASVKESLAFIKVSDISRVSPLEIYDRIENFLKEVFL